MPGVTRLLNPKVLQEKAEALRREKARASAPSSGSLPPKKLEAVVAPAPAPIPADEGGISIDLGGNDDHTSPDFAPKSLADFGVQFELHFENERGTFRYKRMRGHGRPNFALWQEKFYYQMKVDLKILEITSKFQEFSKEKHPFCEDAFGLSDASYVQVVRLEDDNEKVYVLISEKSLSGQEKQVQDFLAGKGVTSGGDSSGDEDEGSFKIELVS